MMVLRPLIAICGTTGVGKSNIAVELALRLQQGHLKSAWRGAKIINADSMQVYEGLDVITNKMPLEDRKGVDHLLMDFKKPGEQYVVGQWVQDAIELINEMHNNGEVPIVVGGTSYWIQHLVFADRLIGTPSRKSSPTDELRKAEGLRELTASLEPDMRHFFDCLSDSPPSAKADPDAAYKMHNLLNVLDPVMAARWHWRDTRKVFRSLEVIKENGRKASDLLVEQAQRSAISEPRFRTLFFWLYAEPTILEKRLNDRVDKMIELGLLDEIRTLRRIASEATDNSESSDEVEPDYTLGIFQAIGYKEFHHYMSHGETSQTEFSNAIDRMKLSTKQYAKRQISWMRNKLIPTINAINTQAQIKTPLYLLDATELGQKWEFNVQKPAIEIMDDFLNERELRDAQSLSEKAKEILNVNAKDVRPTSVLEARRKEVCSICTVDNSRPVMIEQGLEWKRHQTSRSHKRLAAKRRTSGHQSVVELDSN